MMIEPPSSAHALGRSPTNKNTQTGFSSGSMKPMMEASRGRVPRVTPLMKRTYEMPIWTMPRNETEKTSNEVIVGSAGRPEGKVRRVSRKFP